MAPVPVSPLYTTIATTHGGRSGHVKSADGVIDLQLALPKEMGGPGGAKANPETLFAAAAGAILLGERLTPIGWMGAGLMFAATILVQIAPLFERQATKPL